jgi:hypothetical protein
MGNGFPDKLCPFVPKHLINPNKGQGNQGKQWIRKALGKYEYHTNNFMNQSYKPHSMGVALHGLKPNTADWNKCYNKFKVCLGEKYVSSFSWNDRMLWVLPECPGAMDLNSNATWENRYY